MEVLNLFPVLKELMNHTWSIFERYLSGLLSKISNDAGRHALFKQPSRSYP